MAARCIHRPVVMTLRDYSVIADPPPGLYLRDYPDSDSLSFRAYHSYCRDYYRARNGPLEKAVHEASVALKWAQALQNRAILRKVDAAVCVSESIAAGYKALNVLPSRYRVIYNVPPRIAPVELSPDQIHPGLVGRRLILAAGRLSKGKGTRVLLDAMELLDDDIDPNVLLVLAGRDEGGYGLHRGIQGKVCWLDQIPHNQVMALYDLAEIVVIPSLSPDSFSRALLEAMALAKPIIATRCGGTPEALETDVNGVLVEKGDPAALAHALKRLICSPEWAASLGEQGYRTLDERFQSDAQMIRLEELYDLVRRR
jgi:glycosyltransferase involved in cell wall biosynthesis